MDSKLISYILRSKNRRRVLVLLSKDNLTSVQIAKKLDLYLTHSSRAIRELAFKKLIVCKNPEDRQFRFYELTPLGKETVEEIKKILKDIE